jgi:hypothetical protein
LDRGANNVHHKKSARYEMLHRTLASFDERDNEIQGSIKGGEYFA